MKKKGKYLLKLGSKYANCILLEQGLLFSRKKGPPLFDANSITKETTSPKI